MINLDHIVLTNIHPDFLESYAVLLKQMNYRLTVYHNIDGLLHQRFDGHEIVVVDPFRFQHSRNAVSAIRQLDEKTRVLVLTAHFDTDSVTRCFREGATGYVLYKDGMKANIAAIAQLSDGGAPMSKEVAFCLVSSMHVTQRSILTQRERDVLFHMSTGGSYKHVAQLLHVSVHTIRSHAQNIFEKLDVCNRSQALLKARQMKLV
jgi:DNA-binding NarL/FixJ family response regulator